MTAREYGGDRDKQVALLAKAHDALAAMRYLNIEHKLGYPQ